MPTTTQSMEYIDYLIGSPVALGVSEIPEGIGRSNDDIELTISK